MNQNQNPFPTALEAFAGAAQACASEMLENASYIARELPNVAMTTELLSVTTGVCAALTSTGQTVISELAGWIGGSYPRQELAARSNEIVNLLSRNLPDLHDLVMTLRAHSDNDLKCASASILVGESATNILLACTRAADAAEAVSDLSSRA